MRSLQAQSCAAVALIAPVSCANTAAATSSGVPVAAYDDFIMVTQHIGAITGTITGKLQSCDDTSGTNPVDITGATFTAATATGIQKISIHKKEVGNTHLRYVGTIVTGPALVGVALHATAKYST